MLPHGITDETVEHNYKIKYQKLREETSNPYLMNINSPGESIWPTFTCGVKVALISHTDMFSDAILNF